MRLWGYSLRNSAVGSRLHLSESVKGDDPTTSFLCDAYGKWSVIGGELAIFDAPEPALSKKADGVARR